MAHWTDDMNNYLGANPAASDAQVYQQFPQLKADPKMLDAALSYNHTLASGQTGDYARNLHPELFEGSEAKPAELPALAPLPVAGAAPVDAPAPTIAPTIFNKPAGPTPPSNTIPLPDFNNQASRSNYLSQWGKKYGDLEGRGDTVLKVNEVPRGASDTAKNLVTKSAQEYGLDPALLYSSAMEEGMSGLFKNKDGTDTKHRKPGDFGYQDFYGDKEFPINGGQNFGFQTFAERFPELVKGGYLPKEFSGQFRGVKAALADDAQYADANNFKSTDSAIKAKAAMLKYTYDDVDKYASQKGIPLSPKARDFFALAEYNGGEGGFRKLLKQYNDQGLLKDDQFLKERPNPGQKIPDNLDIYGHVVRRLKMRDNLKSETLF